MQTFRRRFLLAIAGIISVGAIIALRAQGPATDAKPPVFEVASVKPNRSAEDRSYASIYPGGRYSITNTSLKGLILASYHLEITQILGGPRWIETDRFDIDAKPAEGTHPSQEQLHLMLKALLADRFQLVVHKESRQRPVYALVKAKLDGKIGVRLKRASRSNCVNPEAPPERGSRPATNPNGQLWCGRVMFGPTGWSARSVTMDQIAKALEPFVGRLVLNRTNIDEAFDVDLEFNPRLLAPPPNALDGSDRQVDPGISVFTALEEQLGLKLDSTTSRVDVLVIDHVEPLTPD